MGSGNNADVTARRQQFFDYFRSRLETARREDIPLPERLLLSSACLDALAKHWHSTADPTTVARKLPGTERMRAFLSEHGGHAAFQRVSAPMFRNATGQQVGSFPFAAYKANQMSEVRDWKHDPTFAELEGAVERRLLNRWSYPGILYVDFRCAWVHNFVGENQDINLNDFLGLGEPHYRFIGNLDKFLLIMPLPFLSATLERAIESFSKQASSRGVLPFEG